MFQEATARILNESGGGVRGFKGRGRATRTKSTTKTKLICEINRLCFWQRSDLYPGGEQEFLDCHKLSNGGESVVRVRDVCLCQPARTD